MEIDALLQSNDFHALVIGFVAILFLYVVARMLGGSWEPTDHHHKHHHRAYRSGNPDDISADADDEGWER